MLPKELSEKIPKGSRLVWRNPKVSEAYIDTTQELTESTRDFVSYHYIVIEPAWTAPDWMPKGWWLAMDQSGEWYLYEEEPTFESNYWVANSNWYRIVSWIVWTPPAVDGAEDSLRQI